LLIVIGIEVEDSKPLAAMATSVADPQALAIAAGTFVFDLIPGA
jgi:hypothetical protein